MSITIKQIAEICGVSRGTVDRVLNSRGRVSPEKAALILKSAKQLGYKPNLAGKALAARKKAFVIGVILPAVGNIFFDDVIAGMMQAQSELSDYGVKILVRTIKGYDTDLLYKEIKSLKLHINALILAPTNDDLIINEINRLVEDGICVINVNNDVENSSRQCYVGSDYYKGGQIACGLMGLLVKGDAKIAILTGSRNVLGHNMRIEGFKNIMQRKHPKFEVVGIAETNDDDIIAYNATQKLLVEHPEINSVFIVAAGSYGVYKAIRDSKTDSEIASEVVSKVASEIASEMAVVSFDIIPQTKEMMDSGIVKATICQQPFVQGYESVKIAFYYLVNRILPDNGSFIVKNEINISESI
jgi:LacI family transcriptional regulator